MAHAFMYEINKTTWMFGANRQNGCSYPSPWSSARLNVNCIHELRLYTHRFAAASMR